MRVGALLFARRRELERLFSATAEAFGSRVPPATSLRASTRLQEYARFTQKRAIETLARPELRSDVERRLFRGAFRIGSRLRLRLRVRSLTEALRATRLVYRGIGIDLRVAPDGCVIVSRCRFAAVYTSEVCGLMSALDRGLFAGLAYYRDLRFSSRITEGAPACTACLVRRRV